MSNARRLIVIVAMFAVGTLSSACAPDEPSASQSSVPSQTASPSTAANRSQAADVVPATNTLQTVRIPVEGMACVACAARVKKTLKAVAGVEDVEVHLGERNARVRFDSRRITADRLVAAIKELGYSAGTPVPVQR
jgi:copper chaperone CopZ